MGDKIHNFKWRNGYKNNTIEECSSLIKGVNKRKKNEAKEQKGGFLNILLGTLGASLLGHLCT